MIVVLDGPTNASLLRTIKAPILQLLTVILSAAWMSACQEPVSNGQSTNTSRNERVSDDAALPSWHDGDASLPRADAAVGMGPDGSAETTDLADEPMRLDAGLVTVEPKPPQGAIPCSIERILRQRCQNCHASTPVLGAPMPLVAWSDFHRPLPSGGPAVETTLERIHSSSAPMPPVTNTPLTTEERSALSAWLDAGAPPRAFGDDVCEAAPEDEALDCEVRYRFHAHAEGDMDAPFVVPSEANVYTRFWFRSPFETDEHAVAWAPSIDNSAHVHHYVLYRTNIPPPGVTEGSVTGSDGFTGEHLFVWAPGQGPTRLPDDVSLELTTSADDWFYLEIHYWNPTGATGQLDSSGVELCLSPPRRHTAGVMTAGTLGALNPILPHTEARWSHECTPQFAPGHDSVQILSSMPHMHQLGTSIAIEALRANGREETLVEIEDWRFDDQISYFHSPAVTLSRGDRLRTTCDYFNPTSRIVTYGEGSDDEMCIDFAIVYPIDALMNRKCFGIL